MDGFCGALDIPQLPHSRREGGIDQGAQRRCAWHQLVQKANSFGLHLTCQQRISRCVPTGSIEARDQTCIDWITAHSKNNGDRGSRFLRRNC